MCVAKPNKIHGKVAGVAIKDEELPSPPRFRRRCALKHLVKPCQTKVIIAPAARCI
jgi:hypothetical protein